MLARTLMLQVRWTNISWRSKPMSIIRTSVIKWLPIAPFDHLVNAGVYVYAQAHAFGIEIILHYVNIKWLICIHVFSLAYYLMGKSESIGNLNFFICVLNICYRIFFSINSVEMVVSIFFFFFFILTSR